MPPIYPDVVEITPGTLSKSASVHQKQPPAKVAITCRSTGAAAEPMSRVDRLAAGARLFAPAEDNAQQQAGQ